MVDRRQVSGWAQSALLPPEHVRIEVTLHLESGRESAQIGVEVKDFLADTTLGLSTWTVPIGIDGSIVALEVSDIITAAIQEHYFPF